MTSVSSSEGPLAGAARVRAAADRLGLAITIVSRSEARSVDEAAALLGISSENIVKSIVLKHKDGSFLFALVPGGNSVSWPKLRALLGVNKISLPDAEQALVVTGYERGTITPLGSLQELPVYIDEAALRPKIAIGAGEHGYSAFVDGTELATALGATVADISNAPD